MEEFPLLFFWKSLRKISINFSLNVWNLPVKPSSPGLFFGERFLITDSVPLLVQFLSFLHDSALVGFMFLEIYPFS